MTQEDINQFLDSGKKMNERIDEVSNMLHSINRRLYPMGDSEVTYRFIDKHKKKVRVQTCDEHPIMGETMTFDMWFPIEYLSMSNEDIKILEKTLVVQ